MGGRGGGGGRFESGSGELLFGLGGLLGTLFFFFVLSGEEGRGSRI